MLLRPWLMSSGARVIDDTLLCHSYIMLLLINRQYHGAIQLLRKYRLPRGNTRVGGLDVLQSIESPASLPYKALQE